MKNSFLKMVVSIAGSLPAIAALSQENMFCKSPDPSIFSSVTINGWVKFQQTRPLQSATIFINNKGAFGLTAKYKMEPKKTITDELGFKHTWMQEFYNNMPVLFGEFILHEKDGQLVSGNGKIYTATTIVQQISLSGPAATEKALQYIKGKKYWWQDKEKESKLKRKTNDQTASYYPKPVLYYYFDERLQQLRPGYQILIQAFDPGKSGYVYVDAGNGNIFLWDPVEKNTCDPTVVNTVWYGNKTIYTYTDLFTSGWDLEDDCNSSTYKIYDYSTPFNSIFNSSNNQWTTDRQRSAATCLWSLRQTRDVYNGVFGRNGHDGDGANIDVYFDYIFPGNSTNNASFHRDPLGDDEMNIGTGMAGTIADDFGTLDIVAHEFTHGVVDYTADLVYERESGALDESFADVFGEYIEKRIFGTNNWLLGWDRMVNGNNTPSRDMNNPQLYGQPDRYLGFKWSPATGSCTPIGPGQPGDNDYCGVHTNSGVQNHMFYLLSVGGSGWTNDSSSKITTPTGNNSYPWSVEGIGIENAVRIAYRALTVYLGANSNYLDSRNAWVHAANDLYGECSFQAIQTGKAWHAVGFFPPTVIGSTICGEFGTTPYNINTPEQMNVAGSCTVNILPTGNSVQFSSAQKVVLSPGFSATIGSDFWAFIYVSECEFARY